MALRQAAGARLDDTMSETSTRFDARISAEAEFLLDKNCSEARVEAHVLEQTWVRRKILEYQNLSPAASVDLATWASIQVYVQGRNLGESDGEVVARIKALVLLAKEGGIDVDLNRAVGRLLPGSRLNAAESENRTSTGLMGTTPERAGSRGAASSPAGLGSTPGVRYSGDRAPDGGESSHDQLLHLISRQVDAVSALAQRMSHEGTADAPVHEPKNIVSNIKYTIDLPILKDADPEVEEFLEQVESQFCNANNGKGVNAREKIIFVRNALEKGGTRRASWELKMKELRRDGSLMEQPREAYETLLRDLRSVMPETPLELKLRKKLEFDALEQGRAGHVEFYVKFKKILSELKDARCLNLDEEDLYLAYITKLSGHLRTEVMRRKCFSQARRCPEGPALGRSPSWFVTR